MDQITTDILLKGEVWDRVINRLCPHIFKTYYGVYLLCASIGIMYDKFLDEPDGEEFRTVPRTVLHNNSAELEILFQTAILASNEIDFDEDTRLELAFGTKKLDDMTSMQFLTKYANYGVTVLDEKVSDDPLETIENIKDFLTSTVEGTNFDIDPLSDDLIDIELEDLV